MISIVIHSWGFKESKNDIRAQGYSTTVTSLRDDPLATDGIYTASFHPSLQWLVEIDNFDSEHVDLNNIWSTFSASSTSHRSRSHVFLSFVYLYLYCLNFRFSSFDAFPR